MSYVWSSPSYVLSLIQAHSTCSSCATCCPWHSIKLPFGTFEMRNPKWKLMSCLFINMYITLLIHFVVMWKKLWHPRLGHYLHFLLFFPITISIFFIAHDVWKNTQIKLDIIVHILMQSSLYVLNFMLPTCRPYF